MVACICRDMFTLCNSCTQGPSSHKNGLVCVLQWRETRTIGGKIKELKNELPPKDSEGNRPASPIDDDIKALEEVKPAIVWTVYVAL
jgi:hypothetical protein